MSLEFKKSCIENLKIFYPKKVPKIIEKNQKLICLTLGKLMKKKMFFIPKERQKSSEKLKKKLTPNSPHTR